MPCPPPVSFVFALLATAAPLTSQAQEVVRTGPPPAIRALVESVVTTVNSDDPEVWEQFASDRFVPDLLKQRSREQRAEMFRNLRRELGRITLNRVTRDGPDEPLQFDVAGSTGATATIRVAIDSTTPPHITAFTVDVGKPGARRDPGGDAPAPAIARSMSDEEISRSLDGYFSKLAAADMFSGVALVAKAGVPVFSKAYGLADRANKIPNTVRTRFNIGSINKTFTQVAINQLVRDGKLAYSDTLGKFFPDYPQATSREATIEQLLRHTGGLSDFFGPDFTRASKDQFRSNADYFRFVGTLPPTFAPGARNQYCNGCYIALGAIIEQASGMPYEQYVSRNIFQRAEMTSTGYVQSDAIEPDVAVGYTRRGGNDALHSNVHMHGAAGSAAGGGYSTAMDLLTYVKAVRAGRFPGAEADMGIAGGAPGTNAVVEANGEWVVIVLTNLDPPSAERIGVTIAEALRR